MATTNRDKPETAGPVHRDERAGRDLKALREELLLTREDVPRAMRKAEIPESQIPCVKTLWRIEALGAVPVERIRFGLAKFYGQPVRSIWSPKRSTR